MREIKFRAWNKISKEFVSRFEVTNNGKVIAHYYDPDVLNGHSSEDITKVVELMQYTGLHDKNGKEIYEGDILHEIRLKTASMANNGIDRQIIVEDIRTLFFNENNCEVIGNIYENPNLLK